MIPDGRVRRVPGLRREEVALLAGVSTDYYTRLEQGRHITPSNQVVDALIRALGLDSAGQAYLRALVSTVGTGPVRSRTAVQRVRPALRQTLDSLDNPAIVLGRRTDVLASNTLAKALFADFDAMPPRHRNYARWILLDAQAHTLFLDWEQQARNAVESLRLDAAATTGEPGVQQLIGELSLASPEFRLWWSEHRVHQRTHGTKRLQHPIVGPLDVHFETLNLPGDNQQSLYLYSAEPGSPSENALKLLGSWTQPIPHGGNTS
ncbi:helix-turn-helix transcriptional regulator [Gordonia liuliyuniae]|uniref:helix-turn-helix transcriptional regulator n=1 Tax=Gordonia liuliyuniae TaxID=2911517 RepID=UPI0027E03523|nr:helix-turn-helix transcriptional regulator [Gordonia liuliyuniae]